jgi:hypothetical protein
LRSIIGKLVPLKKIVRAKGGQGTLAMCSRSRLPAEALIVKVRTVVLSAGPKRRKPD